MKNINSATEIIETFGCFSHFSGIEINKMQNRRDWCTKRSKTGTMWYRMC